MKKYLSRMIRNTGTKQQLVFLCFFSIAILVFTVYTIVFSYSKELLDKNATYIDGVVTQFKNQYIQKMEEIDQIVNSLANNPSVQDYLTAEKTSYKRHLLASDLVNYFFSLSTLRSSIEDISVFGTDGKTISYYNIADMEQYMFDSLENKPYAYCLGMSEYGSTGRQYLLVGCSVYQWNKEIDTASDELRLGIVIAAIDPEKLSRRIGEISGIDNVQYLVFDDAGNRIIGNVDMEDTEQARAVNQAMESGESFETMQYQVSFSRIQDTNSTVITIVDKNVLLKPLFPPLYFSIIVLVGAIVLLLFFYFIAVSNVTRPMNNLLVFLKDMHKDYIGRLKVRVAVEGNRDTILLSMEFNNMLAEIDRLTHFLVENNAKLYEAEIAQKQSEIALLRSQINPHFLYNTLEVIRAIAVLKHIPEVEKTAKSLAKIMRYSIKGYENVRLSDEISILKDYIQIQKVRFRDRFEVVYQLPEDALDCVVPKMCIQPIVENAFNYGLELLPKDGKLSIAAEKINEHTLMVVVEDNGPGIEAKKLAELNQRMSADRYTVAYSGTGGLGIRNVNTRLRMQHGSEYGISIFSEPNRGTRVELRFHIEEEGHV